MKQVSSTLRRLARRLFADESAQSRLIDALTNPRELPTAVVWVRDRPAQNPFTPLARGDWLPDYVDLIDISERPGRHAVHDAGDIYCLDPSSVFAAAVLTQVSSADQIFDLCASPGGKSILAARRFPGASLLCNEVIGKRTAALISNLKRCQINRVQVASQDVSRLADERPRAADVVLVDAPCSGQSLIARGKKSPGCFHPATINMNANRQRRILSHAVRMVSPGGFLAYMTCTYSLKENERNVDWLLKKNPQLQAVDVPLLETYRSQWSEHPCYRLWPWTAVGAGAFTVLLQSVD